MVTNSKRQTSDLPFKMTLRLFLLFVGTIFLLRVSSFFAYMLFPLVVYTLMQKRTEFSFFVLMLLVSLAITNSIFFEKSAHFYTASRVCLFILAAGMTFKAGFKKNVWFLSPFYLLITFIFYMMAVSLAGWCPIVSELKAILFLVFFLALMQGTGVVAQTGVDIRHIRAGMLAISIFYIFGSLAVIPFPSIGRSMLYGKFAENAASLAIISEMSGLFNGFTWHSQCLGPTVALLNAFLLSDYLCNFQKRSNLYMGLLTAVPILVFYSSSRTAFFAYLISIFSTVYFFMSEKRAKASKKSRVLMNLVLCGFLAGVYLIVSPRGVVRLEGFLRKAQVSEGVDRRNKLTDDLTSSRMDAVEKGLANFRESPLIGNGFQVSEGMVESMQGASGLILSAPIEKGVLPVMILEEGGVFGAFLFMTFLVVLYAKYRKLQFTGFMSTFTVFIALNSGEAIFFSTSGGGGILWMTCFSALLMDIHRHRRRLAEALPQTGFTLGRYHA